MPYLFTRQEDAFMPSQRKTGGCPGRVVPLCATCFLLFLVLAANSRSLQAQELTTFKGHTGGIWCVAFAPDGKTLATGGGDRVIKLWNVQNGKERVALNGHDGPIHSLAFSPDGNTLASGGGSPSGKNTVRLWDVTTGKELGGPEGRTGYVEAVAFAPDGKTLAFGNSLGFVKLWDL